MDINYKEILRYLKSQDMKNDKMESLILNTIEELKKIAKPRNTYSFFEIEKSKSIHILNTNLYIKSSDLMHHLRNSHSIAIMAITLGIEVDREIKINEKLNLTKAIIMDAVATSYVEKICDKVQGEIKKEAKKRGYNITNRFSPGYGDLSIKTQKEILNLIDAYKIGITLTESLIMIPRKSVTAFIGFYPYDSKDKTNKIKCDYCDYKENCDYKVKRGEVF